MGKAKYTEPGMLPDEIEQIALIPVYHRLVDRFKALNETERQTTRGAHLLKRIKETGARIRSIQEERQRLGTAWTNPKSFFYNRPRY